MDPNHASSPVESDADDDDSAYHSDHSYVDDEFGSSSVSAQKKQDYGMLDFNTAIVQELHAAGLAPHRALSSKLCEYCGRMAYQATRAPEGYNHTPNVWTLLESADDGCELCGLLLGTYSGKMLIELEMEDGDPAPTREEAFEHFLLLNGIGREDEGQAVRVVSFVALYGVRFEVKGPGGGDEWIPIETLRIFTDCAEIACLENRAVPLRLGLTEKPDLDLLSTLVGKWMERCRGGHRACNNAPDAENTTPKLPTRVLDLSDVRAKGVVRVWRTQGAEAPYIALSHRWGGKHPVMTETGNLQQRVSGFPYTDLPPLFRAAVDTTLALGVNYLWIDSLCIVQDDKDDWKAEAARMADVYMNSHLTIAASAAPNSDTSFLASREKTPWSVKLPQTHPTAGPWPLYVDEPFPRSFMDDADASPLNQRAWVLQERVLSPRLLHFTRTQVYWECWSQVQHETLEFDRGNYHKSNFPVSLSPRGITGTSVFGWYLKEWLAIVEKYTACQLTFASDKLVAIGGLVERIRSGTTNQFCAGVFLRDWHYQLLWAPLDNSASSPLPEAGAPSWSWASREGAVRFAGAWPGLEAEETTRPVVDEGGGLVLSVDIRRLDGGVALGELKRAEGFYYYRGEEERFFNGLPLKSKTQRFRFLKQGDDAVGAFLLDHETGDDPDFGEMFWTVVARLDGSNYCYCLLVQRTKDSQYVRVGLGLLFEEWLHLHQSDVTIV